MSFEDLRDHGVLLPEEEWGTHRLETTVPQGKLAGALILAVLALVAAYLGGGTWITAAGVAAYLAALLAMAWICDRATLRQEARRAADGPD